MKDIFKPYTFKNGTTIKNRFCLAPMTTYSSNDDLTLSEEEEVYYNSRAKQFGMIITAATAISKNAQAFENQISIRDIRYLDSMTRLANSIKKEGSKAILQIHHGGRMNPPGLYHGQDIVSASAVKAERDYCVTPRELRTSEVYDIIDDFVDATKLAIKAGFDGVELHGANTYLIQQFFSPHSNQRDDEFGGSDKKRLSFPLKLTKRLLRTKQHYATEEFIIGYRFSPEEIENPGITLDQTKVLVNQLCKLGVDYLHISLGKHDQLSIRDKENTISIANQLLEVIDGRVPLIGVGGLDTLPKIEEAFKSGYDLVALGLIALSDIEVIDKFKENVKPTKIISKDSLLPSPLFNRLSQWNLESKGYSVK